MNPAACLALLLVPCSVPSQDGVLFPLASWAELPPGVTWRDFNGSVYLPPAETGRRLGLGWTRSDFSWGEIEPENDRFEWARYDRLVLETHARGLEILPILDYCAPWAVRREGEGKGPPARVSDWEDYVEHVVARYSRPPFNLRYFQIWNEPTREAGFWQGDSNRDFIDLIHLPAARIIRRYDGRVVFGGWPASNSLEELDALLEHNDAYRWTDILDLHYAENSAWQHLYDRWVKPGFCRGLWQTEIGFHPFPNYLPNCYLRALHWALRQGWAEPNQYKLFWFATWGAGPDGPKCLTQPGPADTTVLTEHGRRLEVLTQVLGGGALDVLTDLRTDPDLPPLLREQEPTILGFRIGEKRIVIALLLDEAVYRQHETVTLELSVSGLPQRVQLVAATGEHHPLTAALKDGRLSLSIPIRRIPLQLARAWGGEWQAAIGYIVIET